jgi:hypothetical protein
MLYFQHGVSFCDGDSSLVRVKLDELGSRRVILLFLCYFGCEIHYAAIL